MTRSEPALVLVAPDSRVTVLAAAVDVMSGLDPLLMPEMVELPVVELAAAECTPVVV